MAKLNFEFESSGGKQLEQQFKAIGQRIEASEGNLKGLAKALGVSEKELESLAKELGVNGVGLKKLSTYLANSTAAGKQSQEQFAAIAKSIAGLKPETFDRLQRAVKASVTDTAKAADQTEQLAKGYDKAAKSAEKAAKAGSGVSNTTFSKEASADRRNASENARLARQSSEKIAGDNRAAQVAIAEADRISAEKQAAAQIEADQQIAKIQANAAQDIAKFSAAQEAIQREKDRTLDAEIAAAQNKTNRELGQLSAATAKEIAAEQRKADRIEKADDRALQERLKRVDADTSIEIVRIQADSDTLNRDRDRAAAEIRQAEERAAQERIANADIAAKERIAASEQQNQQLIEAFKADQARTTAQLVQDSRNQSSERIAADRIASQERQKEFDRAQREQLATFKSALAAETSTYNTQLRIASVERQKEIDRQLRIQENNRKAQERATARQQQALAKTQQSQQQGSAATVTASEVLDVPLAEAKRLASELDLNARQLSQGIPALKKLYDEGNATGVELQRAKELFSLTNRQLQGLIPAIKAAVAAQTEAANDQSAQAIDAARAKAVDRFAQTIGKSGTEALELARDLKLTADQMRGAGSAIDQLAKEGGLSLAELRRVRDTYGISRQATVALARAIRERVAAEKAEAERIKNRKKQDAQDRAQSQESSKRTAALPSFASTLGVLPTEAQELADRFKLTSTQMTLAVKEINALAKTGGLVDAELDRIQRTYQLQGDAIAALTAKVKKRVADEDEIAQQRKADKANDATARKAKADQIRADREAAAQSRKRQAEQQAQDRARQQEASKRTAALPGFANVLGVLPTEAQQLADQFRLSSTQMTAATREINALAESGNLVDAELDRIQRTYRLQDGAIAALTAKIRKRVSDEDAAAEQRKQEKSDNATARKAKADKIRADREAARAERERTKALDRQRTEESKRSQAIAATSNATGIDSQQLQGLVDATKLTEAQIRQGIPALKKLFDAGTVTGEQLRLTAQQYGIQANQAAQLVPVLRARAAAEKEAADRAKKDDAAKSLAAAQEKAALGFAQILGQPRDQALALAKDLKLTGEQMGPAAKAIAKLATDSKLTGAALADVAEQYRLNVTQAKSLAGAIAQRVNAEKQVTQSALEQANQAKLAGNADAADQKRLAALDQFAATVGLTKDAALDLAQRFGLTDTQMKQATAKIAALAEAGQLTEAELGLVQRQFKLGRAATATLTEAIAARVSDEKDQSSQKKRAKAESELAVAAIGLGQATGLGTEAALTLARQLGLTADQAKSAPGVFARLAKAGVTGQQAIADMATALGLPADKAAPLAAALQAEADRLDGESIDANRKRAADQVAKLLGKTGTEALDLMRQFNLTGDQSKAAAAALNGLAKDGNLTIAELKRVRDTYGLNRASTVALARAIADRVAGEKQAAADTKAASDQRKQETADRRKQQQQDRERAKQSAQSDARRSAIGSAAQSTGLDPESLRALSDAANLTADQIRQGIPALKTLFAENKATATAIAALRERYRLEDAQLAQLIPVIQERVAAEKQAASDAKDSKDRDALRKAQEAAALEFAQSIGQTREQALALAQQLELSGDQMKQATKAIARLSKDGNLTGATLADVASQYRLNADQAKALGDAIEARIAAEKQAANDEAAAGNQQQLAQRAQQVEQKRLAALDQFAATIGLSKDAALDLAQRFGLTDVQMKQAAGKIASLSAASQLTESELDLVRRQFGLGSKATAALVTAIEARTKDERRQAEQTKKNDAAKALNAAQEKAALGFAQSLNQSRDEALSLARNLKLTDEQMGPATKAILKLAQQGRLTGSTLADVAEQYRLNATQAKALGNEVAKRVRAEKLATDQAAAQAKGQALIAQADALDQKRIAVLGQFAAALGISKDAALDLAQRFGLTDTQMKGASAAIAGLAEAGRLTDSELSLVRQQFRLGSKATETLTQAIAKRVADEKDTADQKARDAADAALAKASIALGIATGKTTDEAIALSKDLGLTTEQVKGAPTAFNRLAKAGITGTQAIADLSRELGLTEKQSTALVAALQGEVDRIKQRADDDKTSESAAALKIASVELAQTLGVTSEQLFTFAQGAGLGAKELRTAIAKIGSFAKSADQSDQAFKTLTDGLGLNEQAARKLYQRFLAQARDEKQAADRAKKEDAAKALADAQSKAALDFAQAIGKPRDQALRLARDLNLTGEQMKSATRAIAKLAQNGTLTGSTLADVAEQYRLNATQAKALGNILGQRATAEQKAAQTALEQANQQTLAGRADAVEQKRLAALDQFAASLGISKDAALELAQRFGLTDTQMKGASAKIAALAEAGQLTESELTLVRQQFKVGRAATQELTQAIAKRVADEKKASDKKATDAANAALAKASIGLGVAIGKSTDEAIALAKELGLTADQAKAVPTAFNRLTKAGITGQQAIDDLAREAGLNANQSAVLTQALRAEASRIKQQADSDKTTEANNALRVASVELAQTLGVSADQVFTFAKGADLGAKELKTAVSKIGAFVQGTDQSEQALKSLAQGLGLNEKAAQQLYRRLLAEANAKGQEAQAAKQQQLAQRANQVEQQRIAALSGFADALGLTTDEARTIAERFSLTGDQMRGVGTRLLALAKAGKLTSDELALVQQQFRLGSAATATLTQAIRDRVAREEQQATDQGNARLAKAADAAEQKRIEALGKFADALGLTPAAARELVDRFNLTGEQMRGVSTSFNRLVKSNQLTEDQLALVQQSYRLGSAATDALTVAVRQRVATEQAAADQQAALDAETARQERIKKELKAAYRQEQAALEKAEKADQSRTLAAIEVGRDLNVAAEQITRFADATKLSGAQLKTATRAITKSLEAGTLDQDLAGLSKGLKLSRSAVQFLAKRIQKQADEVAAQAAAQREAEGQANLAAAADKADRERTAALSQFARTLGLTIEQAQELVSRFNLTGTQMKGAGKAIDQLAKAGLLTESELGLVRQQFGLGRSATSALVTAIEARVAAEKAEADAAAAEAARVKQREAIQKELKARYKQQQAALDKAEKADQSRALASIEVARSLNTSSDQLDRFIKSTGLSGEGLRSAARAIGKSVEAGTLDKDLTSLSKGLKLSESAVRFLAGRIQKEADRVAANQAAQREATGQAGLAAAAEKADQQRTAALSQFAQTLGITIEAARDLVQRFGLTGDQMKGAAREIDKLAQAGRLTTDELGLVQQRFKLGSASVSALTDAIAARVQTEKDAAATEAAATAETKRREAVKKALKARYKQEQAELEKAQKADQSRAQAAIALSQSTGIAADRLTRFADATGLAGPQLRAAVSQITTSLKAGTLDQDLATLSQGLNLGESAIRFLAKRIQQQAATTDQAALNRAALPFAQALGQSTAEAIDLAQRLGLTADQLRAVPTAFNRLTKAGVTGEQAIADLARTVGLTDDQSRELATALQAQVDRLKAQESQQQLGEIGTQQKAAYEAALAESAQRERERATEAAKQAGKLGLSAEQTDRFAKAADLGAKELRSAVTTISGLVKSGTATSAALEQLAPGLKLSASAAKFLAKRLQAQADAAAKTKQDNTDQKEAQRQARQLTAIGEKQRDEYATAQANLAKELDKQRVAAIAFGQAIGTTSDRALRYAQALGLSSTQVAAVGPQLQKLLSAGDLQGALSLLTNTYKLSERSARLLIDKVEQRIQSEQAASDAAKQQADLQRAADAETKRRQQLAEQESAEAKKRIDALAGFAAAVGQTPDQALVLANVLKLSSDQMKALPKAIAQLVQSGNDTDAALQRLGDAYKLQDRQLQKLTNSVRAQVENQGQARLAAGANAQDQARTTALPGFAAATGLTEAAARDLVTRFNLTGAQMQLVSGEMSRLAQQGKLTEQALSLLGQRAGIGSAAQQELATALQARVATEKSDNERQALKRASLQLSQALGQTGEEAIALVQSLGLTADQVKVLGPKLATLARQGDVTELALRQLQTATGAPLPALNQLAIAIRANAVAQQQSAQQSGLLQATAKLAGQLGLTADQALRLSQKLDLSAQAIGQVDALKKLYAQGPVSEAALTQFREATGLAAAEFNRLAAAVRSRVALEQREAAAKSAARDSAAAGRSAAAEGKATAGIVQKLDIDVSGLQKLQAETGKSAVELQKVFATLDKLEESSATAEQKIELLARSFNLTDDQAKQLVTTFDRAKTSARELGQNVASAAQDLGMTYGAALRLQKSLGLTSQQFEQAAQRAVMLRQTGATTAQAFDALNKEFGLTREQFDQLDRAALGSQQAMQGLAAAVGSFSVAFVGGLKTALQTFGEFEGELRKAGVLSESFNSNEGRQAFANLEAEVKKLGASTSFTNKQIAEASTELVKSGFTAEQTAEAIGGITKGAIATGESMQQLSEVTGAALNNFGLATTASTYINDLVVATANASPAGVEDIGEALKYVGATAAESNQSVEDIMKMIAQLASVGIKGSTAGTGLAEAMRRLKLASAGSVTEFGNLVRGNKRAVAAFQALQLQARNADGSLKPLPQIIDQLRTATAGFAQEDKDVLMNALFGVEGGRVIQAQLNLTQEKLGQIDKAFNNASGASARAADQMQQGFAGSLVMAQSAIESFQTAIGSALAPVVTYLLQLFTGFLNTVTDRFNQLPGPVKGVVGALAGLAATMTTIVAAAAAFRAAAIALGIAQGIAAAKTVALNVALAAQQGSLLNVAKAMLGFGTATTTAGTAAAAAGGGAGIKGLMTGLAGLKASAAATPAALGAVGLSVKGLAAGLGKLAGQLAIAYAAFEVLRGAWQIVQDGLGQTGPVVELRDAFADLDQKFADIEKRDPAGKIKEVGGALNTIEGIREAFAKLKTEYEDFGSGFNKVIQNIGDKGPIVGLQQSLVELQSVLSGNTEAVSRYGNAWGVVTQEQLRNQQLSIELARNGEKIQETFDGGQAALVAYRKALKDANGDTNAKGVQEANKAVETQIAKIREMVEVLRKAGPDGEIALKPLEAILKSLENRNPAIRPKVQMDPEQAKAEAEEAKNAAKEILERDQFQVKAQVELEFDEAKAKRKLAFDQAAQRDSLAFNQKQDRDKLAFERQLDAERRRLEAAQNAAKASFDRRQQTAKLAFDNQQRARQDAYETAANARKDAFERGQEAKKLAFETSTETRKNTFADQQRAKEATFSQQQEARKRAFETSQLAARKAFEDQLAARDAAKKGEFDAQRAAVERQLQLEAAGSDAERAQLQEQFAKEDAQNARRQQLLAATIAQEQAWEEQKRLEQQAFEEQERLKQQAFEAQQRAEKEAYDLAQRDLERAFEATLNEDKRKFEETLRLEQQAFETAENERKRNFENELRTAEEAFNRRQETARRAFENKLAAEKEVLEAQLADRKLQFEQRQAQEKLKFEQDQDKVKAQFESNERKLEQQHKQAMFDLEAEFKKEQRELDKLAVTESAKAVQDSAKEVVDAAEDLKSTANDLKNRGGGGPTPTPRAKGGPVKRRNLYLVGEKGPELFTPDQDGAIVPHKPTRELMGFAKGGQVRAGETIVVGEKGREAFVPANAQGLKVAIDAGKLRADLLSVFKDGVGQLTQSLSQQGQPQPTPSTQSPATPPPSPEQKATEYRLAAKLHSMSSEQSKAKGNLRDAALYDAWAKDAMSKAKAAESEAKGGSPGQSQSDDSQIAAPVADINQNVAAIAQVLQSKTNPTPRRMGGPVEAGQTYQVGEQGREIFVPQQNGRILSARDSAAVAERAMTIGQMQQGLRVSAPKQPAPAQVTGPSLRDVIRSIGEVRQGLAALGGHTFNFVGNSEPGQDVYAVMRSMRRAAIA